MKAVHRPRTWEVFLCSALALCLLSLSFASVSEASSGQAAEAAGETAPPVLAGFGFDPSMWAGEEMHFSVSMMGGEAARAMLTVGRKMHDDNLGEVVAVEGAVQSVGLLSALVKFRYGGLVYLGAENGLPIWGEKLLEDTGRSRTYTTFYNREKYRASVTRAEDGRKRETERLVPAHVDDIISWIFRLRAAELNVGDEYVFYIFDGWLTRRLRVRVASHVDRYEDSASRRLVRTAEIDVIGDTLDELFPLPWAEGDADLSPVMVTRKSEKVATLWMTLDERRLPLAMEMPTPFGFMRIGLTRSVAPSAR